MPSQLYTYIFFIYILCLCLCLCLYRSNLLVAKIFAIIIKVLHASDTKSPQLWLLPLLGSSSYVVQLQYSDCHNIFYALELQLLAFVLLWRGQSQMKFAVASLENFTTQPMPANQKPQKPPRCLHEQHTYCFLFSLFPLFFLLSLFLSSVFYFLLYLYDVWIFFDSLPTAAAAATILMPLVINEN